jgi:aminoglycoside 6'-N-acetyltransferase I
VPEVRQLVEGDRSQWLELRLALWPRDDAAEFEADITGMLADPGATPAFGAFVDGSLIGFAEASERPWGNGCETAPVGWLEGIFVVPDHRRLGIAAALVDAVMAWAKARGYSELGSDAEVDNHVSIARHAQWGFKETKRTVNFRKWLK